jgi:hypothetical protein
MLDVVAQHPELLELHKERSALAEHYEAVRRPPFASRNSLSRTSSRSVFVRGMPAPLRPAAVDRISLASDKTRVV